MSVGMPQRIYLDQFGSLVWDAFGHPPFLVGSALTSKIWRDVDIRFLMADDEYERTFPGVRDAADESQCAKWLAMCLAWSALGEKLTGLPIDFQIQHASRANALFDGPRSAVGCVPLRQRRPGEFDLFDMIPGLRRVERSELAEYEAAMREAIEQMVNERRERQIKGDV